MRDFESLSKPRPSEWCIMRFGDVVRNVKVDVDPETSGLERYIAGEHMETDNLHIHQWGTIGDGYLGPAFHRKFVSGQVLYGSRRTYLRKVAVAEFDGVCANTTFVLDAKEDVLLQELLPFIMQTEGFTQHSILHSKGSVNPYINWKDIACYEFPLPPLDEQRRIADILWAADAAIVKWKTVLEQVEQARNAFRSSFFGGERGWKRSKLGDLFDVQLGKMLSPKARRGISPKPYLGNVNVQWGWFDLSNVKTMDFDEEEFEKFALKPGDLLVCEGGEVGRSAIWMGQIEDCCYQKALHRLRLLNDQLMPEILLQFMFYAAQHGLFARLTGHSTIAHLTAVKLRMLRVPVPPAEEQQRAIDAFEHFEWSVKSTEQHLERVRDVKDELLESLLVPSRGSAM